MAKYLGKFFTLFLVTTSLLMFGQIKSQSLSNLRNYQLKIESDTTVLDTLSIVPESFVISYAGQIIPKDYYQLLWSRALLIWTDSILPTDSVWVSYRVFNFNFHPVLHHKDQKLIVAKPENNFDPFRYSPDQKKEEQYYSGNLSKTGSITRGISLGNNQDLSVTSGLDLQLRGALNPKVKVLAAITDNNIPIQPDGNTQQLQDFDRVFIQLYNDKSRLIAGDFDLQKPPGYFMKYNKKARGITFESGSTNLLNPLKKGFRVTASAAISKGKFARNKIVAIEGNQGPYKLKGNNNEPFIITLSGSEKIYLDGKLLLRGVDNDYTINYNSSEITFTARQPITKDKRITVDFQYSDKNYVRSLITGGVEQNTTKINWFVHLYSEQDSKNQPLQQDLKDSDKLALYQAGDNFLSAFVSGVDSVGYSNDYVLYKKEITSTFDTIYVYSNHPDSAFYRIVFTQVGLGNGDYLEDGFVAGGKIFRWVQPEIIDGKLTHFGNYAPLRLLQAPKKQQLVSGGAKITITKNLNFIVETALSNFDNNTFSPLDDEDNLGLALKSYLEGKKVIFSRDKNWYLLGKIGGEKTDSQFVSIEQFRGVEFQRDWNLGSRSLKATDYYAASLTVADSSGQSVSARYDQLFLPTTSNEKSYLGRKATVDINLTNNKTGINSTSSVLNSKAETNTYFLRNKTNVFRKLGKIKLGLLDEIEDNRFERNDTLFTQSHQFYFGEVYLQNTDSTKNRFRFFYNQRLDKNSDTLQFLDAALAKQYGATVAIKKNSLHTFKITLSNRELKILNSSIIQAQPEKTLLGRLDHSIKTKKSAISLTSYYEVSSGLELKNEFIYLEVPAGQGLYVWNDYNNNNIKELNEFEVAQFAYEANYIRSFIPSDSYQKVFGNFYSQILQLNPAKVWSNKTGFLKKLTHFSSVTSYRTERKTTFEDHFKRFNPFLDGILDTALVSLGKTFRNTVYFNRTNTGFGINYSYDDNKNKALLTNGFEARTINRHEVKIRWNLPQNITLNMTNTKEIKDNTSDFLDGRNYHILTYQTQPEITWQPSNKGSLNLKVKYANKTNKKKETPSVPANEKAQLLDLGINGKISSLGKGVFQLNFDWINIEYNGTTNNNLAYQMLEGLNRGSNFTWGLNFQRKIAKNIQFNLNYQGRKSENNKAIHAGGMSARAFF